MSKKVEIKTNQDDEPNLKGDYGNVVILFFLYCLQGVPMGLTASMSVMLQNRGVSYSDQSLFYLSHYPFSFKILWAPIVDCAYFKSIGRRKTWLLPSQIAIGTAMLVLAERVDEWFGEESNQKPQIVMLTSVFFLLYILAGTQDIAVDGWSLTMMQRKNIGYISTINNVGQSFGALLGFVVFLTLESKDFCNKFIFSEPSDAGLISFSGFVRFWGVTFILVTLGIAVFKKEDSEADAEIEKNPDFGITKAYPLLWKIVNLKPILLVSLIFSTVDISFSATDMVTNLKLIDYGVPKDKIALFNIPSFIAQLAIPIAVSKYTAGKYPMNLYFKCFPYRLILSVAIALFVYATPTMLEGKLHDIPVYYYATIMIIYFIYQAAMRAMFTADMSFFARVADPAVGGTYMTLMNICYAGGKIFKTFSMWFVDVITWKSCAFEEFANATNLLTNNKCADDIEKEECKEAGGLCRIDIDGYYIEVALNVLFGIFWFQWAKRVISYLQNLPQSDWHVLSNPKTIGNTELEPLKIKAQV